MESITVKGRDINRMPDHLRIIAALVKRLGGEVILSENELQNNNFTGVVLYLGDKKDTIIIKAK